MMRGSFIAPPESFTPWRRIRARTVAAVAGLVMLLPAVTWAQQGTIAGTVLVETALTPIAGAQVSVAGTGIGTQTDAAGRFRLTGLSGDAVTLQVRRIGFQPVERAVSVGETDLRITMVERVVELNEVVVTGTPIAAEKRTLGNAVATIDADEITEKAQPNNLQELLNARATGVVVLPVSGAVGTGSRIRVRGASSFSLSNQPLIYVDGVRINSDAATGPVNAQAFGSQPVSRLNDINPEDIESIEVIKGPAAATLYGTEASNGVIQIITKRGAAGDPRWTLSVKQGANYLQDPEGRFWLNYQEDEVTGEIITIDIVEREEAAGRPIWRTGHIQEYDGNVSGGSDLFRYFFGVGLEDTEGIDPNNWVRRFSTRANLSVRPSEQIGIDASLGYTDGTTKLPCEAGCGGRVWGTVLADPRNLETGQRGFHSGIPEEYDILENHTQDINRFLGSLQVTHRPIDWLSHRLTIGVDHTREDDVSLVPRVDSLVLNPVWGSYALGWKSEDRITIDMTTFDYAATATVALLPDLNSSTSVGAQYYARERGFISAYGEIFPAPGLSAVSATTTNRLNAEDFLEEKSLGFFGQQQFGWRDRLFVTVGLRSDDHSAFGQNFDRVYYPKVSGSWVVSEEQFWTLPLVEELRVRAAFGETGQQPVTFSALRTYRPVTGPNDEAAVTPQLIGNPDLGPERGREIEVGFDAGLFENRFGLEFTYYHKTTEDAILERAIAPSGGFSGFQPFNAGEIRNSGFELQARAVAYESERVDVELILNVTTNDNEVVSLGDIDRDFVSAGTFLRHQIGYPVGSWFEQKIVSAEFDADGDAINVMCANPNDPSGVSSCATAPDVFLGRTTPSTEGAFSTTVTLFERFRLYGLLDFKRGYRKVDGNTRVRCYFFGGRCRENFFPTEFEAERIAAIQSGGSLVDILIDDASFTKLREVSLAYTLPEEWAATMRAARATVGIAGRNLYTWTDFDGLEPEATFHGGSRGGGHSLWEQTTTPQLTQWVLTMSLTF